MDIKNLTPEQFKKLDELNSGGLEAAKEHLYNTLPLFKLTNEQEKDRAIDSVLHSILLNYLITEGLL